ncbi:hypothetical protein AWV80_19050 [Cupriavidus sp. UYMU48A]|nr:hypothetical protein AWV80_19050 [Cupriavidus sp. UYMU48A]
MQRQLVGQDQDALRRQQFACNLQLCPPDVRVGGHAKDQQVCVVRHVVVPPDFVRRKRRDVTGVLDVLEHLQQPETEQRMLLDQQGVHCCHSPFTREGMRALCVWGDIARQADVRCGPLTALTPVLPCPACSVLLLGTCRRLEVDPNPNPKFLAPKSA